MRCAVSPTTTAAFACRQTSSPSVSNGMCLSWPPRLMTGGFGSAVSAFCVGEELPGPVLSFGIHDTFVQHGRRDQLLKYLGLEPRQMAGRILSILKDRKAEKHER